MREKQIFPQIWVPHVAHFNAYADYSPLANVPSLLKPVAVCGFYTKDRMYSARDKWKRCKKCIKALEEK